MREYLVLFELKALCYKFNTHLKVLTKNTTDVHTMNNMDSCCEKPSDHIVRQIWNWAIKEKQLDNCIIIPIKRHYAI